MQGYHGEVVWIGRKFIDFGPFMYNTARFFFFFFFFWINLYSGVTDPRSRPVVIQSELPHL